jgi:hypothetical protein
MATGTEILESKEWKTATPEKRQKLFVEKVAKDPNYANADAETQQAIRVRFGLESPAEAPAAEPVAEPTEAPAEEPAFAPIAPMPPHLDEVLSAPEKKPTSSATMAGYGAAAGGIKGLLEKYLLSPDKLQRDLYARSIKNVLQEAGVDVMGVKDEKGIIDLARTMMPKLMEGQQSQLGTLQKEADVFRGLAGAAPEIADLGGFPTRMSGQAVPGASGAANWMRAMAGAEHQLPETLIASAEDMTKTSPKGAQTLIRQDLANLNKIRDIGASSYQLAGQGKGQLMLPPKEAEQMAAQTAAKAAQEAQIAREALGVLQPQIASVEAEIARLTRLGKDTAQFTARLEQLRRMERVARQAVSKGLNIPAQAELSPLAKLGYKMGAPGIPGLGPVVSNVLAGAGAGYDISEAFDRASGKDPLGAAVHGISAALNTMSMVPPVNPAMAAIKGVGTLGGLGMIPVKMMLPGPKSVMETK